MGAQSIPAEGQVFAGENPQVIKVAKVTVGFAASNDVQFTTQTTKAIFNVPAGALNHSSTPVYDGLVNMRKVE